MRPQALLGRGTAWETELQLEVELTKERLAVEHLRPGAFVKERRVGRTLEVMEEGLMLCQTRFLKRAEVLSF